MKRPAFTLIELLVVIAIIGLLATFSVVQLAGAREKARLAKGLSFSQNVLTSVGDDLVGRWDFDECSATTASDVSGYNGIGVITNGTVSTDTASGKGCSMSFNGTDSVVTIPDRDNLSFPNNAFTFSLWVKPVSAAKVQGIFAKNSPGYEYSLLTNLAGPAMNAWISSGGANVYVWTPFTYEEKWNHIVMSADGSKMNIYKDGVLVVSRNVVGGNYMGNTAAPLRIGWGSNGGGAWNFEGLIDDFRVYSRALSSKEIHQMYAEVVDESLAIKER